MSLRSLFWHLSHFPTRSLLLLPVEHLNRFRLLTCPPRFFYFIFFLSFRQSGVKCIVHVVTLFLSYHLVSITFSFYYCSFIALAPYLHSSYYCIYVYVCSSITLSLLLQSYAMDLQYIGITVAVFGVVLACLLFFFKFGIKEKSYEEALAEQRQQANALLGPRPKPKEKKVKKSKKVK